MSDACPDYNSCVNRKSLPTSSPTIQIGVQMGVPAYRSSMDLAMQGNGGQTCLKDHFHPLKFPDITSHLSQAVVAANLPLKAKDPMINHRFAPQAQVAGHGLGQS